MDNIDILGICPTCYKVVRSKEPSISITSNSGTIFYHHNCEPDRMKFMKENAAAWEAEGLEARALREKWSITVTEMAEVLCVSENKIRKFEYGKPVTHAKLLGIAYHLYIKLLEQSSGNQYV